MVFLVLFVRNGLEIYNKLHVTDEEAVTGKFSNFADSKYNAQGDEPAKGARPSAFDGQDVESKQGQGLGGLENGAST